MAGAGRREGGGGFDATPAPTESSTASAELCSEHCRVSGIHARDVEEIAMVAEIQKLEAAADGDGDIRRPSRRGRGQAEKPPAFTGICVAGARNRRFGFGAPLAGIVLYSIDINEMPAGIRFSRLFAACAQGTARNYCGSNRVFSSREGSFSLRER